jgi:hypothetical protein
MSKVMLAGAVREKLMPRGSKRSCRVGRCVAGGKDAVGGP